MDQSKTLSTPVDASSFAYVVGVDIGSQTCRVCALTPDKRQVVKPTEFANATAGFALLCGRLEQLGVPAEQILIGMEATSRYGENLYHVLAERGDQLCLLHPRQTHQFAQQRGLRAKTDKLDASTIARVLLSGEARRGYVPTELIATYRELVRLHTQLSDETTRYKNEIHALLDGALSGVHADFRRSVSGHRPGVAQTVSECASHRGSRSGSHHSQAA